MKIDLPSIAGQQTVVYERATARAIEQLQANLHARRLPPPVLDESIYSRAHLLRDSEGWQAPDSAIVRAYFAQFQDYFPDYGTDAKLAALLGLSSDRRMREFKHGSAKVPYHVWRRFLEITGRVPPEVPKVFAFMGEVDGQQEIKI